MRYRVLGRVVALGIVSAITLSARAEDGGPEGVLKGKGLSRAGAFYAVDADVRSQDAMREVGKARAAMEFAGRKRGAIEAKLKQIDATIAGIDRQYQGLNEEIAHTNKTVRHNQLAGQINSLASQIREAERTRKDLEKQVQSLGGDGRDEYVAAVTKASDEMEAGAKSYEELAKDKAVAEALADLNREAKVKWKLGPTPGFTQRLDQIRKERQAINSAAIKLEISGGVPVVSTVLNGSVKERMVVDSGASLVTLTAEAAIRLGLKPGASDPVVHLVVANGKKVVAHLMHLKSVQVGQFVAADVECAVLPGEVKGAECLLGGTFFRNFVYRMDLAAGELHLTQTGGKPKDGSVKPVALEDGKDTAPTPRPATAEGPKEGVPTSRPATAEAERPKAPVEVIGSMYGDVKEKDEDGAIVLRQGRRITTERAYGVPVAFTVTAQTDSTNIRIRYGCKQMIFNWEMRPEMLQIDGGPAAGSYRGKGKVPVNKWVAIGVTVTPGELVITVDGKERVRKEGDFSEVKGPIEMFTAQGAVVKVKSVKVEEGKGE